MYHGGTREVKIYTNPYYHLLLMYDDLIHDVLYRTRARASQYNLWESLLDQQA